MPQLLQEITHLSTINGKQGGIIAEQRKIIDRMQTIEDTILNMKQNNTDKQTIFNALRTEVADLKETNAKLRERIMELSRKSPIFIPNAFDPADPKSDLRY